MNLYRCERKLDGGLDGCARWRDATITVTTKKKLVIHFRKNFKSLEIKLNWGLDGCARWRKLRIAVTIKQN